MDTHVTKSFDPYHRWLGISAKDQPPHHYRLLGVDAFESDLDVIEAAADRQMIYVRSFQTGEHGELTQRILNELSTAKLCLLAADRKAAYDEQLRAAIATPQPVVGEPHSTPQPAVPTPIAPTVAPTPQTYQAVEQPLPSTPQPMRARPVVSAVVATPSISPATRTRTRRSKPRWLPFALAIGAGVIVMGVVLAAVTIILSRRGEQVVDTVSPPEQAAVNVPATAPEPVTTEPKPNSSEPVIETPPIAKVAAQEDPPSPPVAKAQPQRAIVSVERTIEVPFNKPTELPGSPTEAFAYQLDPRPKGANIKNGVLSFSVEQDGLVYLVTSTNYQGNRSGGWWEERVTKQDLVARGWTNVGPCPWKPKETLLSRTVKKGESYRIRTNKYGPPRLIVPIVAPTTANQPVELPSGE